MMPRSATSFLVLLLALATPACDSNRVAGIDVVRYDGAPITSAMNEDWTGAFDAATGTVTLSVTFEDTNRVRRRLHLTRAQGDLPAFSGYTHALADEEAPYALREGRIAIQSFDVQGEVSGRLDGTLWRGPINLGLRTSSIFFVDLGAADE